MKNVLWIFPMMVFTAVVVLTPRTYAQSQKPSIVTYQVYTADNITQSDKCEYIPGERVTDEITSLASKDQRKMELLERNGSALSYEQTLNGLPELRVTLDNTLLSFYEHEAMVGALAAEDKLIIFEPTAFGEYRSLLNAYNTSKGGKQRVNVVIPSLQDYVPVDIERHGTDALSLNGVSMDALHYRIAVGKKELGNVWVDQTGSIVGMYLANKELTIVDISYEHFREQIKKIVNRAM